MRIGLLQLNASDDPAATLAETLPMIEAAAADGASLIATPEVTNCVSLSRARQVDVLKRECEDQTLSTLRAAAERLGAWILIGSLALKTEERRFANRSILIAPDGQIVARYDKIHMFDVDLGGGEAYRESDGYRPGERAVCAALDAPAVLGMSICYDLRFPALYRALAQSGANILAVPSAFTRPTGAAHWEVLLRARAIETGAFVIAPAQTGVHLTRDGANQRETWGHSLVVDPWGKVLLDMGTEPGWACVDLDLDAVSKARQRVPSLLHDPEYTQPDGRSLKN